MHRVLIIDDSSATRAYVRAALEEMADLQVSEASSGFDALRILPRERFDLLLVDINMPNINGLELISFIRRSETHRDTPLLIISTEASERDRARAIALGNGLRYVYTGNERLSSQAVHGGGAGSRRQERPKAGGLTAKGLGQWFPLRTASAREKNSWRKLRS